MTALMWFKVTAVLALLWNLLVLLNRKGIVHGWLS